MLQLAVILPTYKERNNVARMVERLDAALAGFAWEAIFVDDNSPDGTADEIRRIARSVDVYFLAVPINLARRRRVDTRNALDQG